MLRTTDQRLIQIHNSAMEVLGRTGMRFLHPRAVEALRQNGIRMEGNVAYFTEEQLMHWVSMAPERFTVYARDPRYNMEVGGDTVHVMLGTGAALVGDWQGNTHIAQTADFIRFVKLYEQNEDYRSNGGGVVQAQDVDPRHRMTTAAFCTLLYSRKVIEAESIEDDTQGMLDGEQFMELLQLAFDTDADGLRRMPRCIAITNTNSPLQFDKKMLDMLFVCAQYGQPVCISACSMAGTTGPVTLAGNLVVTNAEVLAGIALAQMVEPSCPVAYGCQSTISDLRTGAIAIGTPEAALTYQTGAELAKMYGLPCRGGGAHTDAYGISAQSGYESMLTLMATYGAKTNLIFHSSGIMHSYAHMSYEKLMIDFEIVAMVKRFFRGIDVNEETLAVDAIEEAGVGGGFIASDHTLGHMRTDAIYPEIGVRKSTPETYDSAFRSNVWNKMENMLRTYQRPHWSDGKINGMKQYLIGIGVDKDLLERIVDDRLE